MYRKGSYIAARLVSLLIVVIMGCLFAVNTPYVQTRLSEKAIEKFNESLNGIIDFSELTIMPSGALLIKDALIRDNNPLSPNDGRRPADTLFYAERILASFSLMSIFDEGSVHIGRVSVENAIMHLVSEPTKYKTNLNRIFDLVPMDRRLKVQPEVFNIKRVIATNFNFRLGVYSDAFQAKEGCLDYFDLDLVTNAKAHNLKLAGGKVSGVLDGADIVDKCGYRIDFIRGRCSSGQGKSLVENIHLIDQWSDIKVKSYSMSFDTVRDFAYYTEKILMEGKVRGGRLGSHTLKCFSGLDLGEEYLLDLSSGHFKGYVNDFKITDLKFVELLSGIKAHLDCSLVGLPDISTSVLNTSIHSLDFNKTALNSVNKRFLKIKDFPKIYSHLPGNNFVLSSNIYGPLNRLQIGGKITSREGSLRIDGDLRNLLDTKRDLELRAKLDLSSSDIGRFFANEFFKACSLHSDFQAVLASHKTDIMLDDLTVSKLEYKGNEYNNLSAIGTYRNNSAALWLESEDSKLDFSLSALANLGSENEESEYRFKLNFRNIDLRALELDKRAVQSYMSFNAQCRLVQKGKFIDGNASIKDVIIDNLGEKRNMGDSYFTAEYADKRQSFSFTSPMIDASLEGSGSIKEFISDIKYLTLQRDLSTIFGEQSEGYWNRDYSAQLLCKDSRDILSYLLPGLYIAENSSVELNISQDERLFARLTSPRVAFGNNYLKDIRIDCDNFDKSLNTKLQGSQLHSGSIDIHSPQLMAFAQNNKLGLSLNFDQLSGNVQDGEIVIDAEIIRDDKGELLLNAHPLNSYINTGNGPWLIEESLLHLWKDGLKIDNFRISNKEQFIVLDGGLSQSAEDTLSLKINDLNLALFNDFLTDKQEVHGRINGNASFISTDVLIGSMNSLFTVDSLSIESADAGSIQLAASLDAQSDGIDIYLKQLLDGNTTIYADGLYYPQDQRIDMSLDLNRFPVNLIGPFTKDLFTQMDGSISGKLRFQGPVKDLSMSSSDLHLSDALLRIAYTNVPYTISGPMELDNTGLHLKNLSIADNNGGRGTVSGCLFFNDFSSLSLDTSIDFDRLSFLDTYSSTDNKIYGQLKVSGNASLSGFLSDININADVHSYGQGNIHIPTSESGLTGTSGNLLVFTEPEKEVDPYEEMLITYEETVHRNKNLNITARIGVSPEVKAYIELDRSSGNMASFNGNGSVNLNLQPAKDIFELNGEYIISNGDYNFLLPGIISRNFSIQDGSSLHFGGDIANTELNIDAIYKLKTSLSTLVADSTTVATRRQVECGINISDRLSNPKIDFSINVPDLDPTTKSRIETALGTTDKVQRQFLALLVMGSFIPDESSGVFNGSNILLSNATELMSNQLNTIFQKLQIPVDVGIGYQASGTGTNMFDVAISTQLFNDRVIVGGSVGNRLYGSSTGPNGDMVGDLDIQIKLDADGKYRFNIFSHSADKYSSYLDYSQRNGVGLSFQRGYSGVKSNSQDAENQATEEQISINITDE